MENYIPSKNVIHISDEETSMNYLWENNSEKLSNNIEIVSIDKMASLPETVKLNMFDCVNFEEGMVFIKDEINNRYVLAENASDIISERKFEAIMHIAGLLGAKKIIREEIFFEYQSRSLEANGDISYKMVNVDAKFKQEEKNKSERRIKKGKAFSGNTIQYDKALDFAKKTKLIYDPQIRLMLEQRHPENTNRILEDHYESSLTKECDSSMDAAFKLNILKGVFNLSANVKEAMSLKREIKVSFTIEYGQ